MDQRVSKMNKVGDVDTGCRHKAGCCLCVCCNACWDSYARCTVAKVFCTVCGVLPTGGVRQGVGHHHRPQQCGGGRWGDVCVSCSVFKHHSHRSVRPFTVSSWRAGMCAASAPVGCLPGGPARSATVDHCLRTTVLLSRQSLNLLLKCSRF